MHRSALAPSVLTAALLLTACGSGDGTATVSSTRDAAPATTSATPSATASAVPTPAPTPAGTPPTGSATPDATPDMTPAPDAPGEYAPQDVPPGTGRPAGYPTEAAPTHGARLWGVYLGVGAAADPWTGHALGEAEAFLQGQGFVGSGIGEMACDQGAAEQLGLAPDAHRLAVYFATAEQARQFVDLYERDAVGTAQVTTFCLD